jgi:DNA-binding MarR family transcriptional regulator
VTVSTERAGFRNSPHLIGLVALVGRLAQDRVAAALSPLGVTYAQAVTLVRLWRSEAHALRQRDLIESLGVSRATGSQVLNQLDDLGLIERRWDEADARNRVVTLTGKGRDLESPVLAVFDEVEEMLQDGGSERQIEAAFAALGSMLSNERDLRSGDRAGGRS